MTVKEFYEYGCRCDLRVLSGYNGKVICERFDPKKHTEIGEREILSYWADEEITRHGFFVSSRHFICCSANGAPKYKKHSEAKKNMRKEDERK